jgi:hypothetical protein
MNAPLTNIITTLRIAGDDLAADNAKAALEADKRDWKELERLLRKHGISNVIGIAADLVGDIASEFPEDSNEARDYELAQEVLSIAAEGCDLTYGFVEQKHMQSRRTAIKSIVDSVNRLRA